MVMGAIWLGMIFLSVGAAFLRGNTGELTPAALEGAGSAVTLCISLAGALCLWSGISKVMERAGLTENLGRILRPVFRRLFPQTSRDETALGFLTAVEYDEIFGNQ